MKQVGHNRVWAVGPVLPMDGDDLADGCTNRGGSSTVLCNEVMTWLNGHEDGSVAYLCFGSRGRLTRKQMDELAAGLKKTGVHFVWCVRQPKKGDVRDDWADIPDGFDDRVAGIRISLLGV